MLRQGDVAPSVRPADEQVPRHRLFVDPSLLDLKARILKDRSDFADGANGEAVWCKREPSHDIRIADLDHRTSAWTQHPREFRAGTSWTQHDGYRTSRRAARPTAFLIRSETYTEKKMLKMSSRSRVSLELVMRHCPSIFSYVSW